MVAESISRVDFPKRAEQISWLSLLTTCKNTRCGLLLLLLLLVVVFESSRAIFSGNEVGLLDHGAIVPFLFGIRRQPPLDTPAGIRILDKVEE